MKIIIICTLLLSSVFGVTALQAAQENQLTSILWEYKMTGPSIVHIPGTQNSSIEDRMNYLGSLGWELVIVIPEESGRHQYIFKRIKK